MAQAARDLMKFPFHPGPEILTPGQIPVSQAGLDTVQVAVPVEVRKSRMDLGKGFVGKAGDPSTHRIGRFHADGILLPFGPLFIGIDQEERPGCVLGGAHEVHIPVPVHVARVHADDGRQVRANRHCFPGLRFAVVLAKPTDLVARLRDGGDHNVVEVVSVDVRNHGPDRKLERFRPEAEFSPTLPIGSLVYHGLARQIARDHNGRVPAGRAMYHNGVFRRDLPVIQQMDTKRQS